VSAERPSHRTGSGPLAYAIVESCEQDLERYGDTYQGVGWTKSQVHADLRYRVMLELVRRPLAGRITLLDVGCGASHLYEHMRANAITDIEYSGLDLSSKFLALSARKFPDVTYFHADLLDDTARLPTFDYVVLNGLFNYKGTASHDTMWAYVQALLRRVAAIARIGFAFNVMTKYLDWERDDLFHLPLDMMAAFIGAEISRAFVVRHDYGLFEYTVYVYKESLFPEQYEGAGDSRGAGVSRP
jgi:SAM-dependent methyltransferase